jgi:hypothetical protein
LEGVGVEESVAFSRKMAVGESTDYFEFPWRRCSRTVLRLDGRRVIVPVAGFGEKWTMSVGADGRVTARISD